MEPALLHLRAEALSATRDFFERRNVLEVETPCLESVPASDPHLEPIAVGERYLRTSPEFAMKRLLAAGSGDVYQIGKVFRGGEVGTLHNPEFTMLEWYRCGWDYRRLMEEADELLHVLFGLRRSLQDSEFVSCRDVFASALALDPWRDDGDALIAKARELGFVACRSRAEAFDFLMDAIARTHFDDDRLTFVAGYPPEQALLARITEGVAERFEAYFGAVELVNGYTELTDASECRRRFASDNAVRTSAGKPERAISEALLDAFEQGTPDCAGASLGMDRALMCIADVGSVAATLAFAWDDA